MANNVVPTNELEVLRQLHQIAGEHAGVSHERLVLLDLDPEKYPAQRTSQFYIKSGHKGPLDPEFISFIANGIDPRFSPLERLFGERHQESPGIQRIVELMRDDNNVVNGTDHAELIDIALSHLALAGVIKHSGLPHIRTGLLVSKMVDFLGVQTDDGKVASVRDLLSSGFNLTWLSIPRTISTSGKFDEEDISKYNERVRESIAWTMNRKSLLSRGKGPMLLGVALPGTVNKLLDDGQGQTTVIGRVSKGILDFTGVSKTATVATSIRLDQQSPKFFIDELPMFVKEPSDIDSLMGRLIMGITALDGGNYVYDAGGNLPVKRIARP